MPKTRQQTVPKELPARAAKRSASDNAAKADATGASVDRTSTRPKRRPSADPQSGSAKKQKVEMSESDASAGGANNKENTPSVSHPRRGTRSRTPRLVSEVTPGSGLLRAAKGQGCSHSKASQSTPKQPNSAGKAASKPVRGRPKSGASTASGADDIGNKSCDLPDAAEELQPQSSHLHSTGTEPLAETPELPSAPFNSPPEELPALSGGLPSHSPAQPISIPSPGTHPSQHGLPSIPHQQPRSPLKPNSPAASALAAISSALASSPAAGLSYPDGLHDQSSQEHSRHSSGHSNDHPTALVACKHLDWESTIPYSGSQTANSKPPLSRGLSGTAAAATHYNASDVQSDKDESWWDPADPQKVCLALSNAILTSDTSWP